jgi:hypothetical protein
MRSHEEDSGSHPLEPILLEHDVHEADVIICCCLLYNCVVGQTPHEVNYFLKILRRDGITTTIDNGLVMDKSHSSTMESYLVYLKQIELSQWLITHYNL